MQADSLYTINKYASRLHTTHLFVESVMVGGIKYYFLINFRNHLSKIFPTNLTQFLLSPSHVEKFVSSEMPPIFLGSLSNQLNITYYLLQHYLPIMSPKTVNVIIAFPSSVTVNSLSGDCNGTRTHNHLVHKRTLNHLDKLTK